MHDMTAANLRSAFGGESQAHMRYKIWGDVAQKEGFPKIGKLFHAVSFAEQIHATSHFSVHKDLTGAFLVNAMAGFGIGHTKENLANALEGENFEINEMYPTYKNTAEFQGERNAERSFLWALETEKEHAKLFQKAKEAVEAKKDMDYPSLYVCKVCGYTHEGEPPGKCPLCGAPRERIEVFK
ncbi:MAG: rubrerythrin family protein [Candidatus Velamenicoccus archaeovorus]